jgi:hypothetical protein
VTFAGSVCTYASIAWQSLAIAGQFVPSHNIISVTAHFRVLNNCHYHAKQMTLLQAAAPAT